MRIHWLHAVALPDEDSLLCLFDAEHLEDVLLASSRAGLRCPHAQQAIAIEPIA